LRTSDFSVQHEEFRKEMEIKIIKNYGDYGVNAEKIVQRIIKYAPHSCIEGLKEIYLLDKDPENKGFARYFKGERRIALYLEDIVGWQPWFLKKSFVFPYLTIGIALGHEIDHHVNRDNGMVNREKSAEKNALKYVYPSMGFFKPIVRLITFFSRKN
jgi:hypothetical protein